MKRALKRIVTLLLVGVTALSVSACGDGGYENQTQEYDSSKAQLYVSNFNGGVGSEWLNKVVERFTEEYKDTEFLPGTKGVQVWVEMHKKNGASIIGTISNERNEVYFMSNTNYYDFLTSGKILDITDMVTEKMTKFNEEQSIEDKMPANYVEYFKTSNGKYYAIPHYETFTGITYDVDLFDENTLFFDAEGGLTKTSSDSGKSNGPDGIAGTYDDGLPATYDQFFYLAETMQRRGVTPINWSGKYGFYTTQLLAALKADYEGENTKLAFNFNGKTDKLVDSINNDGSVVFKPETEISEVNGYETYSSAGSYYALKFLERIISGNFYDSTSANGGQTHLDAQKTFLTSCKNSKTNPIGMLVEGSYWTHEATSAFQQMTTKYGENYSEQNRRLAVMPYPKVSENEVGEGQTVLVGGKDVAFINANIKPEKVELAKLFLQYCETNKSLVEFLQTTNITRGYNFTMTEDEEKTLNPFAKSVREFMANANHVLSVSNSEFYYKNYSSFSELELFNTKYATDPVTALLDGKSAKLLFEEIKSKYSKDSWTVLIGK